MIASSLPTLPQLIRDYFSHHLVQQRNSSPRTIASYRDTMRLLLGFLSQTLRREPSRLLVDDFKAGNVERFLDWLETNRGNTVRTRNNRFAAIRAFLRYAAARDPTVLPLVQQVQAIPMKRFDRPRLEFLRRDEMQVLLNAPDLSTWSGRRDRAMFAVFYNTGARVSEIARVKIDDVDLHRSGSIVLHGKGRKQRVIPFWKATLRILKAWLPEVSRNGPEPLFPNASGKFLTRSGIESRLKRTVSIAEKRCESFKMKRVSPHTLRHSTAMHLLQSGVDITVIALWLGHESPATTHIYVEADLEMKQRALDRLEEPGVKSTRFKPTDSLLRFLDTL